MDADSDLNMSLDSEANDEKALRGRRLVIIVLIVLGCVVLTIIGCFAGLFWIGSQAPENISVEISEPGITELGQEDVLSVAITNTGSDSLELNTVGIDNSYLDGFLVGDVEPAYSGVTQYDSSDRQVYEFYTSIAPGETLLIEISVTALYSGDYRGELEICINSSFNCRKDIVRTIIK